MACSKRTEKGFLKKRKSCMKRVWLKKNAGCTGGKLGYLDRAEHLSV